MVRRDRDAPANLPLMPVDFSRFAAVLRDLGVAGEVRELSESAPTAAAAAAQLGCELGAIANSRVFSADGAPPRGMTSAAPPRAPPNSSASPPRPRPTSAGSAPWRQPRGLVQSS